MANGLEKRIAIIDDNETDRTMFEQFFRDKGYEPILYKSGNEAVSGLAKNTPPVALIDLVMPGIPGLEIFERTKHLPYQPIFMSGLLKYVDAKKLTEHMPQLTSFNFIEKSPDFNDMYALVEKLYMLEQKIRNGELPRQGLSEKTVEKI